VKILSTFSEQFWRCSGLFGSCRTNVLPAGFMTGQIRRAVYGVMAVGMLVVRTKPRYALRRFV
jgi:hypothetical protein